MSDTPAGTPEQTPAATPSGATPAETPEVSEQVTVSKQFKEDALKWKGAAEEKNRLKDELAAERAKSEQLARLAYGGGQQATDPAAEAYNQALAQAEFDPVARLTVLNTQRTVKAEAESWLARQLLDVPASKREQVEELIRGQGYRIGADRALEMLTDPDSKAFAQQMADLKAENERLKNAKPNGVSPASATPANASADDGRTQETIKMSEYNSALLRASAEDATEADKDRARALKVAVGGNRTRLERD